MASVFLSYSRDDRDQAELLVRALEAEGLDVWWDPKIDPGTQWHSVIEARLKEAKCVIVMWTPSSIESRWVREEALHASRRGVLVQAVIGLEEPPFGFVSIQAEDLTAWSGDPKATNFRRIRNWVEGLVKGETPPMPERTTRPRLWRPTQAAVLALVAGAVFGGLLAGTLSVGEFGAGTLAGFGGLCLAVVGLFRRSSPNPAAGLVDRLARFRFPLEQGFFGGLFGGALAAPIISLVYYSSTMAPFAAMLQQQGYPAPSFWRVLTEILMASALIGSAVGIGSYGLATLFAHLGRGRPLLRVGVNAVTGGLIGCVLAGLVTGPISALHFGPKSWPVLDPATTLLGALPATGVMVFSIVSFDRQRVSGATLRTLVMAFVATLVVAAVAFVATNALRPEIEAYLDRYLIDAETREQFLMAGLYYGGFVGVFLGAIVGLTTALAGRDRGRQIAIAGGP